ncbi:hypothetical protein [Halogeometricum luteum]|uniref:Uncharacterized protein n=1 Tax=Halogeometricum luteum TaxID=2950537 RepID=A0ABU2G3G2_9EURY|nr:hypothetical protein [Halogeometricum sp. S3BR5-2]MDS0295330.1 hypothetical protein [Halogeometricum sp. S3BR5-2]
MSSYGGPDANWTTSVVETERGPMLAVEAEEIVGEERYYLVNENGSLADPEPIRREDAPDDMTGLRFEPALTRYEIMAQVTVESFGNGIENGTIETRYPRGNSSLLSATYDYSPDECDPVWSDEEQTCTRFQADMYASYDTKSWQSSASVPSNSGVSTSGGGSSPTASTSTPSASNRSNSTGLTTGG